MPLNPHLPDEIEGQERVHRLSRRRKLGVAEDAPTLGIALSGGGIRSATLCLGAFQYLAREEKLARRAGTLRGRLLSRIDYCSSVSGGGYFATFFGSLFLPKDIRESGALVTPEAMRAVPTDAATPVPPTPWELAASRATDTLCDDGFDAGRMTPLRWLRENGRYLAPNGGSDYLYAAATAIRNFFALHYVIAIALVAIFLVFDAARVIGYAVDPVAWYAVVESRFTPGPGAWLWPSLWSAIPLALFALALVPIGVAYFLAQAERWSPTLVVNFPLVTALGVAVACLAYVATGMSPGWLAPDRALFAAGIPRGGLHLDGWRRAAAYVAYCALAASALYGTARATGRRAAVAAPAAGAGATRARATGDPPNDAGTLAAATITRTTLSHWMMPSLVVTLVFAAYALVDTFGQTIYARWTDGGLRHLVLGGGTLALLIPLVKRLLPLVTGFGDSTTKSWVRIPATAVAFVAGAGLLVIVATVWSVATHALVFAGERPYADPACAMSLPADAPPLHRDLACPPGSPPIAPAAWAGLLGAFLLIALMTGRTVGFINLSSLQRYYAGHLMRSYLRASLFAEDANTERDVRKAARRDDITLGAYYHEASLAPLHLVNVTMNQTVASRSSLVERDRKGMNLAIGPFGFAIGNRGYVRWNPARIDDARQRWRATVIGTPDPTALPDYAVGRVLVVEPMSIGNWCAISGAALTTGQGKGTTLGLSLLLALTNVRLGYWWNTAIAPPDDTPEHPRGPVPVVSVWNSLLAALAAGRAGLRAASPGELAPIVFSTQSYLFDEMTARYHGARRAYWYLSDGGHFENTAAYELVRRRTRHIIVLDNGRDANYAFDDVANLVRKARIDFGARIEFLSRQELWAFVDASVRDSFGTPQDFAPGSASKAYALLARVHYDDGSVGLMMVVKPRVTGLETIDIRNYRGASPDFPQQSTNDQFYDEAQWESYRALGSWIAERLFADIPPADAGKWIPRKLFD